jgi:hypothetical protein
MRREGVPIEIMTTSKAINSYLNYALIVLLLICAAGITVAILVSR